MAHSQPATINVRVHSGAEHTTFDVPPSTTLGSVKDRALRELNVVSDPNFDYLLKFEGQDFTDENLTLEALLDGMPRPHVEFHLKKRPKGGSSR